MADRHSWWIAVEHLAARETNISGGAGGDQKQLRESKYLTWKNVAP